MPGRLDHLPLRCKECGGWDVGGIGMIMHSRICSKRFENQIVTCEICGFEILPGERRGPSRTVHVHLDCLIDYEHHLDEEHA